MDNLAGVLGGELDAVVTDRVRVRVLADYHGETARRARQAIQALVRAGYHLGAPPYGYRAVPVPALDSCTLESGHDLAGVHAPTAGARAARWVTRHRLVPDTLTASVVVTVFTWRVQERVSARAIATRLAADPTRYPVPRDPVTGQVRPWTARRVRALVTNPVYTGRTVWGRTRRHHSLPPQQWILSGPGAHHALVDDNTFAVAAALNWPIPVTASDPEPGEVA